ncbi:LuxR C-terminal-related transcriptional regulator [Paeniglutamicibacter sp. MACA_103]|uniref:helix-turn-helix transcriptional regulator n=1 Tax=Paeniglutamicibacter sp. MACA_103 TaxID=3377337 RepID=UPI0038935401
MKWGKFDDTLPRPRIDLLLDHAVASSVVIARAPRGSGKRTAIRGWLSRRDPRASSWTWIECSDSTEPLGEVLARTYVGAQDPDSHLVVLVGYSRRNDEELLQVVQRTARRHPQRRMLIVTRDYLELERRRTLLPIDVSVLPPHEFRFTAEEAAAYLQGTVLAEFSGQLANDLCGTPQMLRMAKLRAETMQGPRMPDIAARPGKPVSPVGASSPTTLELDPEAMAFLASVRAAVDRDVKLMLEGEDLEPGQLDFLAVVSVPTTVPAPLLPLLAAGNAEPWLSDLEGRGLVYRSSRNPDEEYCLHPVLRRVLKRVYLEPDPERLGGLHRICARYETTRGSAFRALRHALEARDYQLASDVLRMHADEYLDGELGTRGSVLLDDLPLTVLARFPLLAICLAIAYSSTGKFKLKTLELLALAAAGARTVGRKAAPSDRLIMVTVESVALRLSGISEASVRSARGAMALYREMSPAQRDGIGPFEGPLLIQLALCLHAGGVDDEALIVAEQGVSADQRHNRVENDHYADTVQAYLYALNGDVHKAAGILAESLPEHWSNPAANHYFATPYRAAAFLCAMEGQRFDDAARWVELLRIDQHNNEFWPYIRLAEARLAVVLGETTASPVRMQGYLVREREQPVVQKAGRQMLVTASSLLNLAAGDASQAFKAATKSADETSRLILQAGVRLAQGDAAEVLRLCTALGVPVQPRARFEQAVLVLAATLQQGNLPAVGGALRMVAALGEEYGLGLALNLLPAPDLERILTVARELRIKLKVDPNTVSNIPGGLGRAVLSSRELAVLGELVSTGSAALIADRQFVSVNTVKSQLRSIYRKLGVSDRASALDVARVQGLVPSRDIETIE